MATPPQRLTSTRLQDSLGLFVSFRVRMAFFLIRLLDSGKPLLPVVVASTRVTVVADKKVVRATAVADKMPPTAEDYIWTYTETGEPSLRPVVVAIGAGR